jgi:hypothetical protein
MAAICIGAIFIASGGYLLSIKKDQPNYTIQRNVGIFFLILGVPAFLYGLTKIIIDRSRIYTAPPVYVRPAANVVIPQAYAPPLHVPTNANRAQNAQYGANRAMLEAQFGKGNGNGNGNRNRMQYWQGH